MRELLRVEPPAADRSEEGSAGVRSDPSDMSFSHIPIAFGYDDIERYVPLWAPVLILGRHLLLHVEDAAADAADEAAGDQLEVEADRHVRRRGRRGRDQGRASRDRRLPVRPEALQAPRREGARRESSSTARPGPARRSWRRRSRTSRARPSSRSRRPRSSRCSPAWARRASAASSRRRARRRPRSSSSTSSTRSERERGSDVSGRARSDAQPAAGRDGRLQLAGQRRRHGRIEPPGEARQGAASAGPLRPAGVRPAARPQGPHRDPQGPHGQRSRSART